MRAILKMLVVLALGGIAPGVYADGDIQVRDPWVQAAPPGVKVMAAYMEINNSGKKPRVLISAASPVFDQVGIHRSMMHGDMVHMEHLKDLTLPPQARVPFKPGGLHLMLIDAKKPLAVGDQVPIALIFKGGEKITFTAVVRSGQTGNMEDHSHMDHSKHGSH